MELEYLKKLEENKKIGVRRIKGLKASKIKESEEKLEISFPKAYNEFLLLAGESSGALQMLETADLETLASDFFQNEILKEELEESVVNFEKPFWVFASGDGFWFFYLDEGDDPMVYFYTYEMHGDYDAFIDPLNMTFSEFIVSRIDSAQETNKTGIIH